MPGMDWDEVERRLRREAAAEDIRAQQQRDEAMDQAVLDEVADMLGMSVTELETAVEMGIPEITDDDVTRAMADIKAAKKAWKKGKRGQAKRLMGSPAVRKAAKAAKKSKGCAVVLGAVLATMAGAGYGVVELASSLLA